MILTILSSSTQTITKSISRVSSIGLKFLGLFSFLSFLSSKGKFFPRSIDFLVIRRLLLEVLTSVSDDDQLRFSIVNYEASFRRKLRV